MRKSPINFLFQFLKNPSNLYLQSPCSNLHPFQVCPCNSHLFFTLKTSFLKIKHCKRFQFFHFRRFTSTNFTFSSFGDANNKAQMDFTPNNLSGIGESIISRCSHFWEDKAGRFVEVSLQELLKLFHSSPGTIRSYWRVSCLKPDDVLQILLNFEYDCKKSGMESKEVESLWRLFNWAANQSRDFDHLPRSYTVMISMLIQVGLLREAETLLQMIEIKGILFFRNEAFGKIIEGYVEAYQSENSVAMYDRARRGGVALSESSYLVLLSLLIKMNKAQLALRVFLDMIEAGYGSSAENHIFEFVIGILCKDGNTFEARRLLNKVMGLGGNPSGKVLNDIADGYCEKKDFEDLLNFLTEWQYAPDSHLCNKIITSQCRNFGSEKGWLFLQKLETLGFVPSEMTFGILISWSCKERKLKNALMYLSEILNRGLQPCSYSYDALISGMFKEGMGKHAKHVYYDVVERGIKPDFLTFRVLLAGYCKDRNFEEAKLIITEMVKYDLIFLSHSEDALSKTFTILGLDSFSVKVKRDNDAGLPRAEFFDTLGNGLYLETDHEKYDKTIMGILDGAIFPNLDQVVIKACVNGDIQTALWVKNDIDQRGEKLSSSAYSKLLKGLYASQFHFKSIVHLLEEMVELRNELDPETLNLLVQATSKRKMIYKARQVLDMMLQKQMVIENETFTSLVTSFCKERNREGLQECWEVACRSGWLPKRKDCRSLFSRICKWGMLKNAMELSKSMVEKYFCSISDICNIFLRELCNCGFTNVGHVLVEEILSRGLVLDHAAFNHLARGFLMEKKYCEAIGIIDVMLEKNMVPCVDVCSLLIPQLCKSNKLEKVVTLKEIMLSRKSAAYVSFMNSLIGGLFMVGKVKEATHELQEMVAKGVCPNNETLRVMLRGYCLGNNLSDALKLLSVMLRKCVGLSISSYRNLVKLMCLQGRVVDAVRLKDFMMRQTKSPHLIIYNILISSLFQTGQNSHVLQLLSEMHENLILDQVTYNVLICGHCKCNDVSNSVGMLKDMIGKNLRPSSRSLRMLIIYLCSHGEFEKALELSGLMESRGWMHGSIVQYTLVEGLLKSGRLQEAELFLNRIEEKGLIPDKISYDVLIRRFCGYQRVNKAVDLLNVMLRKGSPPGDICYNAIINGLCVLRALDQALDFLAEMLNKNLTPSMEVYDVLVRSLCANGKTHEAEKLLDVMLHSGQSPTRNMYQSVIDRYRLDNNLNKASELVHEMQKNGYVPDFDTHWSLISHLSNTNDKDDGQSKGFLSQLLSQSGFPVKNTKAKGGKPV